MSAPHSLPPLPVSPAYQHAQNEAAGEWKAEAVKGFWSTAKEKPAIVAGIVATVALMGLVWFFQTRSDALTDKLTDKFFGKLDGHVEALKQRDITINKEHGEQIERVVKTSQETIKEVKEMSERSQLALERAYQLRSNDRPIGVSSKP